MDAAQRQAAEAAAFRSLVAHLDACGGAVQNIDLMNLAGFCRNCLSKWYLAGARAAGAAGLTYDDACVAVYGEPYADWKKKHQKKATAEQLELFERMKAMHAHDRAASGFYADESGPAAAERVRAYAPLGAAEQVGGAAVVVPDEAAAISAAISRLAEGGCDLVLTTGGTGLAPRDVTPEATRAVLDREAPGLVELVRRETAKVEPRAGLSRAVAGARGKTLVINLPGRPKAVREALDVLLPLLPHAVAEVSKE
eukprot:PRCOL_00002568-RA